MITATRVKDKISLGVANSFRGVVHDHHGGKHDSAQADMVLVKELKILHTDLKTAGRERHWSSPGLSVLSQSFREASVTVGVGLLESLFQTPPLVPNSILVSRS